MNDHDEARGGDGSGGAASFAEVLIRQSQRHPDHGFTFLRDGERDEVRLTLEGLHQRARAIAAQLQELDLQGERALLLFLPGLDFIAAFFGCLYAGVIAVPAYPPDPSRLARTLPRLRAITANAEARAVLTTAPLLAFGHTLLPQAPDLAALRWLAVDALDPSLADRWRPPALTRDDLAFLQFTSGSTGTPKGVMVSHGNLIDNSAGIHRLSAHDPESVIVSWVPSYHDMGLIGGILQVVYAGAHGVLMSPMDFLQRPARWLWAISRHRGTTSPFPNFALDLCVRKVTDAHCVGLDLSAWRMAFNGAEPVRAESLERFAARFRAHGYRPEAMFPGYGLAESTVLATGGFACAPAMQCTVDRDALRRQQVVEVAADHPRAQRLVGAGRPVDGMEVAIVDPATGRRCPPGRTGEVWLRGSSVAHGYWGRPEESARTFGARLEGAGEEPFLRTGDLGFLRQDTLFISARLKDLIIVHGANYYPHDLEHALEQGVPQLRPGCIAAFSAAGDADEQLVIAAEVDERRGPVDVDATVAAIREAVARGFDLQVHGVALLRAGTLPKTSSGKLQRQPTRLAWQDGALDPLASWIAPSPAPAEAAAPEDEPIDAGWTGTEAALSTWLRERVAAELGVPAGSVGTHRPFAEYGLGSRALVGLSGELETYLGRRVSPTLLYDHPSIASLARHLVARPAAGAPRGAAAGTATAANEPIAVVSMACRFPGGVESPEDLWALLTEGRDAITEVPAARWDVERTFDQDPSAPGRTYSRWGGFVGEIAGLDAQFFGISPREAVSVDPQARLLLETSWEALERARILPETLLGSRTGVYVGICGNEYQARATADLAAIDAYSLLGTAHSTMVGRLSYWLGLRGPNLAVDTACSSSLVAVHLACQALRAGECDLALAGGVNVLLSPEGFVSLSRLRALSPTGRCRTFAEDADGYVRAEGCGVVVLKRLADALRDGDPVLAVVRGTAVNQDGRSNGLTAPSGPAQQAVLRQALADGGLDPASVSFVECHGTGTPLGDPIEVQALAAVYGEGRAGAPVRLGSVKSNLGHAEGAAGVAGLMKVVLALGHRRLPASLHADRLNPLIPWGELPVEVTRAGLDWEAPGDLPRRAGVSSFGFSGTNAHVVLEEAPAPAPVEADPRPGPPPVPVVVPVSARTDAALRSQAGRLAAWLGDHPDTRLDDLALSLATTRAAFPARLALTLPAGAGAAALRDALTAFAQDGVVPRGGHYGAVGEVPGRLAVLFSGQGAQRPGMGLSLRGQPGLEPFSAALDAVAEACAGHLDVPLLEVMADDRVHRTVFTQPALFALEVALFRQWEAWGLRPDVLLGHSVGELAAAHVAGVFSLADAAALVCARGRLMDALATPGGAMASLDASEAEALEALPRGAVLAAVNAPRQTVVSGDGAAVDALIDRFRGLGRRATRLHVSHAFHSPHMDGMLRAFEALAAGFTFHPPQIPVLSNVTGRLADPGAGDLVTAAYWARHVRESVRFAEDVQAALARNVTAFLECGPDGVLCGMTGAQAPEGTALLSALRRDRDERQALTAAAAGVHASGQALDLRALAPTGARTISLPTYAFQRERHWIEARPPRGPVDPRWPSRHIPGRYLALAGDRHALELEVGVPLQPELVDHRVQGRTIVAGAWQLGAVLTALQRLWPGEPLDLEDVVFAAPLFLDSPDAVRRVVLELEPAGEGRHGFQLRAGDEEPTLHCSGAVRRGVGIPAPPAPPARPEGSVQALYDAMEGSPLDLGPRWRWFERLGVDGDEATLELGPPAGTTSEGVPVPGPLLDAAMVATALVYGAVEDPPRLPFAVGRLRWTGAPLPRALLAVRADRAASSSEIHAADAVFFGPDGAPVLQIERLILRLADLKAGARALMVLRSQPARLADEAAPAEIVDRLEEAPAAGHGIVDLRAGDLAGARGRLVAALQRLADPQAEHLPERLTFVTTGAQAAAAGDAVEPEAAALWGLLRVARVELPHLQISLVDADGSDLAPLARLPPGPGEYLLRGGRAATLRLEPYAPSGAGPRALDPRHAVLVTGGTGALGQRLARHLVLAHGIRHLVLVSRRGPDAPGALALRDALRDLGAETVALAAADVTDAAAMRRLVADLERPLGAVIHAAGVLHDQRLADVTDAALAEVVGPKLDGARILDAIGREAPHLTHFVLCSSAAGLLGNGGQAAYAAANAALDGLALARAADRLPATSVVWGPWAGAGMAADLSEAALARLTRAGMDLLSEADGLALFDAALAGDAPVVLATRLERSRLGQLPADALPPLLRHLGARARPATDGAGALARRLQGLDEAQRRAAVTEFVHGQVARVLGLSSPGQVNPLLPLREAGLDSLMAVELRDGLAKATGVGLPATVVFDHPTPAALVRLLLGRIQPREAAPTPARRRVRTRADEPIAIVSAACRLPGGVEDMDGLWRLLNDGVDAVTDVPASRWRVDRVFDPDPEAVGKTYSRWGGFVGEVAAFDPMAFGISPREAIHSDPQQRLLLEVAYEAIERAGLEPAALDGSRAGVYVGVAGTEYQAAVMRDLDRIDAYSLLGTAHSALVGRLSYWLGLQGPNFPVDTACSSSLVALHLACQGLRDGDCDLAFAGGVNLMLSPAAHVYFSRLRALSPTGRCRTFSADADGYVRAEGCGLVLLKRLADARRDGDPILALVRGTAVNQDGRSNGFTAPNGPAQEAVIRAALDQAGIDPGTVDAVECHGTGTPLGDPIEVQALAAVYGEARPAGPPVVLGSIKTNIGHAEAAAGIAGVLKAVAALGHRTHPRSLHFTAPNPNIDWASLHVRVAREALPWEASDHPRRVGVSSFGFSGTNAHVILEEAPTPAPVPEAPPTLHPPPLVVSGRSEAHLRSQAARWADWLEAHPGVDLAAAARSAALRAALPSRAVVVEDTVEGVASALRSLAEGRPGATVATGSARPQGRVVFVFPGQGSQWPGMGRALLRSSPVFAAAIDACDAALRPHTGGSVRAALAGDLEGPALAAVEVVQPALFAMAVGLAALWRALGVEPDFVVGHSQGEVAAAVVSGALSLADGARIVALRSRLVTRLRGQGAMGSVEAPVAEVEALLAARGGALSLAAVNGPTSTVVAGDPEALDALLAELSARGGFARRVSVDYASHCAQVDPVLAELREGLAGLTPGEGPIPLISTLTGEEVGALPLDADYWCRNLREPVRLDRALDTLVARGATVFVEVSAHPVLTPALTAAAGERGIVVGSLRRDDGAQGRLLTHLGQLWAGGGPLEWAPRMGQGPRADLPPTVFLRERYLVEAGPRVGEAPDLGLSPGGHPLLGAKAVLADGEGVLFTGRLALEDHPWLADHMVLGTVIVPGTVLLGLALAAAREVGSAMVSELTLAAPLVLAPRADRRLQLKVGADEGGARTITLHSRLDDAPEASWTLHASGRLSAETPEPPAVPPELSAWPPAGAEPVDLEGFYPDLAAKGYAYGPAFQRLQECRRRGDTIFARVALPDAPGLDVETFGLPVLLDACLHTLILDEATDARADEARIPFSWSQVALFAAGARELRVQIEVATGDASEDAARLVAADASGQLVADVGALRVRRATAAQVRGAAGWTRDLYRLDWTAVALPEPAAPSRSWVLGGDGALAASLDLRHLPDAAALLAALDELDEEAPERVFVDATRAEAGAAGARGAAALALTTIQALLAEPRLGGTALVWWTRGAVASGPDDRVTDLAHATLWGLVRAARSEHPGRVLRLVDLGDGPPRLAALQGDSEPELALRGGVILAPRLTAAGAPDAPSSPPIRREPITGEGEPGTGGRGPGAGGTVLVTGGTGALGRALARHLVEAHGVQHLLLTARRGGEAPGASALVEALEAAGARTVTVAACDVADAPALARLLASIPTERPLRAVYHLAGVLGDGLLARQTPERLEAVLRPKVDGAWNLHEQTQGLDLAAFVLFSSVVGVLGAPGQGPYAAANAFLDALAAHRRASGQPGLSLAWGLWAQEGVGLTAHLGPAEIARMRRQGIVPMTQEAGLRLLDAALPRPEALLIPARLDLRQLERALQGAAVPAALRGLLRPALRRAQEARSTGSLRQRLAPLSPRERQGALLDLVRQEAATVLALGGPGAVAPDQPLKPLGLDSLMALELRNRLAAAVEVELPATSLFDRTPAAVAEVLQAHLWPGAGGPGEGDAPVDGSDGSDGSDGAQVPLTPFQQLIWLDHGSEPGTFLAFELLGPVVGDDVRRGARALVARHDLLRTRFVARGRGLVMEEVDAVEIDVRELERPGAEPEAAAAALREAIYTPFDVAEAPLLRLGLASIADGRSVLGLAAHHLIYDAISLQKLVEALFTLLATRDGAGEGSDAPSFLEVARALAARPPAPTAREWWRGRLAGARWPMPVPHEVEVSEPELVEAGRFLLDEATTARLAALARGAGATQSSVGLLGWAVAMGLTLDRSELLAGAPISSRSPHQGALLGPLVDDVLLRVPLQPELGVAEALQLLDQGSQQAAAGAAFSLLRILECLQEVGRVSTRCASPCPVLYLFYDWDWLAQGAPSRVLDEGGWLSLGSLQARRVPAELRSSRRPQDYVATAELRGGRLGGHLRVQRARVDQGTGAAIARRWEIALRTLAERPAATIRALLEAAR